MDFIALTEEQFGQVTAVLTRNSCDERFFHRIAIPLQSMLLVSDQSTLVVARLWL